MSPPQVEALNVSPHGFWLWFHGKEWFLAYEDFPWFRNAKLSELFDIEVCHGQHLHWRQLDVDLDLDRIAHPENYPLVAKPV